MAFVDPKPGSGDIAARRYLLTIEQFQDVWAQESGRRLGTEFDLGDLADLGQGAVRVLGPGAYDRLVVVGDVDGVVMVTFTTPHEPATLEANPPSAPYRATLIAGLVESHGLSRSDAMTLIDDEVGFST